MDNIYAHNKAGKPVRFEMNVDVVNERAHYWYTLLADCKLEDYDAHPPLIDYEITFLNGGSHLPADEEGMTALHATMTLVLLACCSVYCFVVYRQHKALGQIHLVVIYLGVALALQTLAVMCEWCHLRAYDDDGKGLRWRHTWMALDFLSEVWQGLAELIISFLLVALSFGWTLSPMLSNLGARPRIDTFWNGFANMLKHPSQSGSVFLLLAMCIAQLVLEMLGRRYEDDFNQFHDHEHWPGYAIMGLRLLYCFCFWQGIRRTTGDSSLGQLNEFLRKVLLLGTVWFLAFPLLVVVCGFLPPTHRHKAITIGAISLQTLALGCLARLFTSRQGVYFKLSSLSKLGTLFSTAGSSHLATE